MPTGQVGYFISLLIDEEKDKVLSGNVIRPFVAEDCVVKVDLSKVVNGTFPIVNCVVDTPMNEKSFYVLHSIKLI